MSLLHPDSKILAQHAASAVVHRCVDFRLREGWAQAIKEAFGVDGLYDDSAEPGGACVLASLDRNNRGANRIEDIVFLMEAHHTNTAILLNHTECGAVAGILKREFSTLEEELHFHTDELRAGGRRLLQAKPDANVLMGFLEVLPGDSFKIHRIELV